MTVASMMKAQGYYTADIGKWHLGLGNQAQTDYSQPFNPNPTAHGFDYYFGIPGSLDMEPYLYFENDHAVEKPTSRIKGSDTPRGVYWREGAIAPSFKLGEVLPTLTDKALALIRERAAKPAQPFFLYLPLNGPHTPWLPTGKFRGSSKARDYGDFVAQVDDTFSRISCLAGGREMTVKLRPAVRLRTRICDDAGDRIHQIYGQGPSHLEDSGLDVAERRNAIDETQRRARFQILVAPAYCVRQAEDRERVDREVGIEAVADFRKVLQQIGK